MKQKGFTLIELIAVIVILGILSATAIPQFLDLRNDARNSAAAGIGGGLASAASMNYAGGLARSSGAYTLTACVGATNSVYGNIATMIPGATQQGTNNVITVNGVNYLIAGAAGPLASGAGGACTIVHAGTGTTATAGATAQAFQIVGCANASCS